MSELHQADRRAQLQDLHKQLRQCSQVPLAEVRDGAEIGHVAGHDHHEVGALPGRLLDPPRRVDAAGIAVQQQRRHQAWMKRRLTQTARIAGFDLAKVEALAHQRHDQPRQVVLWHIVLNARRQQLRLIDLPRAEMLAHAPGQNPTRPRKSSDYSDRLLVPDDR